jgi:hypothetical protein
VDPNSTNSSNIGAAAGNVAVAVSLPARTCHRFYTKVLGLAAWSFSTLRPKIASLTPQLPSKGSNN